MFFRRRLLRNQQKRLVISVGAGTHQLPLIRSARELGFDVLSIDRNSMAPGVRESQYYIQESTDNQEEITRKISELLIDCSYNAVLSRSFGPALNTVSRIAQATGLSFITPEGIKSLLDKKLMKECFIKHDIKTAPYKIMHKPRKSGVDYPCIIKPLQGHAKQGVKHINSFHHLEQYFKSAEQNKSGFLVEDYITGSEIIAIGIVRDGKFMLADVTDKITTPLPWFVDIAHISPSSYIDRWDDLNATGQKIADAFGIINAPLLFEAVIDANGDMFVIETAAEFGGEYLADHVIPAASSWNIFKAAIMAMHGGKFPPPPRRKTNPAVIVHYLIAPKKGKLCSFRNLDTASSGLIFQHFFKKPGDLVQPPVNNHDRLGVIIVKGSSLTDAKNLVDHYLKEINISVE